MDIVRDSTLGQLVRWVTGNKVLLYPEENPGFAFQKTNTEEFGGEKSRSCPESLSRSRTRGAGEYSASSSSESNSDPSVPQQAGNTHIVDWYGPADPSNPMNWSPWKKRFVAFQIWSVKFQAFLSISN
jgi:DHA1 family multidrug resistance protein-like MFS transporter